MGAGPLQCNGSSAETTFKKGMGFVQAALSLMLTPSVCRYAADRPMAANVPGQTGGSGDPQAESPYLVVSRKKIVTILQFLVGGLVTFGGTAYTVLASDAFGNVLGAGHLTVGIFGLFVGVVSVRRRSLPAQLLIAASVITIVYSVFSESLAIIQSLLPDAALHDSLVGTIIAIAMSSVIIYILSKK